MKTSRKTNRIVKAITANRGRIFGLTTNTEALNARFVSESPQYVTVYDNNANRTRKLHKTTLKGFRSSAIDPGTGRSVYITAIINGTDAVISDGVALSASDDIILGKNTNINFDPPLQVPAGETVTPKAGVTVGYFIGRATRTTGN